MKMNAPQTMAEILTRIEQAVQRVVQVVTSLSPDQMAAPQLAGGRSVKDLLAHLTWWDQWLLFTLPADPRMAQRPSAPPLFDQIPPGDQWAEEMNGKVHAYNQSRSLAAIQAEFTATYPQLLQRVSHLTLADIYNPAGLSATIGQPVAPLVLGIYEHYEEHAHELEQMSA
ncbi:MAG: ClbS/DfsB family four-helix bundle protein [Caldilinea sp. CFX5]|nr:ClbS/DfsB family four-helix bundle protein [Caldilinea sp. CFX5]